MKKKRMVLASASVLALITGLSVSNAHGQPVYVPNPSCVEYKSVSYDVMTSRQNGEPIDKVLSESPELYGLIQYAYETPIMPEEYRESTVIDFSDDIFRICDDTFSGVVGIAL